MEIESSLVALGQALEDVKWQPEGGMLDLLNDGREESRVERLKLKAILFLRAVEAQLRKALCTPAGSVRPVARAAPELLGVCTQIISSEVQVDFDAQLLVEVVTQSNLDLFCSTSASK
ncbi:hypothetical protein RA27_03255 [Ruegeria sp. ANG-R]|uniref:hypothetical protein n=1 Tax=Ruegeria sp. ANG-R TaxID=1577903 RepID=UPI00058007C2|nr:hypothetical protein [Ruegeria sp. ANG-R]KIC42400.1 hypothetical protein RA27_03255 [Ruegeria sp. ANG-R]